MLRLSTSAAGSISPFGSLIQRSEYGAQLQSIIEDRDLMAKACALMCPFSFVSVLWVLLGVGWKEMNLDELGCFAA